MSPSHRIARGLGGLSRRLGRGGGTSLPGAVLIRARPDALARLGRVPTSGSALVAGTNGKTTATRMLTACMTASGLDVVGNRAGANLASGIATALLDAEARRTRPDLGVFEVDEFALPEVAERLRPRVILLLNLSRDQLDRYGELEAIAARWEALLSRLPETVVVGNADDPLVASLLAGRSGSVAYGVEDRRWALDHLPHAADSTRCRRCGADLVYDLILMGHQGRWSCPSCGEARPEPDAAVVAADARGADGTDIAFRLDGRSLSVRLPLPGLHNVSNAAGAAAAARALGARTEAIVAGLECVRPAFGRAERVALDGRDLVILLAKNPAGTNENVRTCLLTPGPLDVLMGLEDRIADGRDVSWIWDVDIEPLVPRLRRLTLTGSRAHDLALRFRYAGLATEVMRVLPSVEGALDAALAETPRGGTLHALATYTAMLDLRGVLEARGQAPAFWRDGAE